MNWKRGLFRFWLVVSVVGFLISGYVHHVPIAIYAIYTGAPTEAQYAAQQLRTNQWENCAYRPPSETSPPWEQFSTPPRLVTGYLKKCGPEPKELPSPPMMKDIAADSLIAFAVFGGSVALFLGAVFLATVWIISGLRHQNLN